MPADLPPVAANGTHLACYVNHQTPKHPNWPTGNLGRVASTHRFQGWSCVPNKQQAAAIVQIHIKIDDQPAIQMEANISRPDLRGKTPCLGAEERHGFIGEVPAQFQKGKHTMSAFAIIPGAPPVLLGEDSLCDGVSCPSDQEGHLWRQFDLQQREWNAEQSLRALL